MKLKHFFFLFSLLYGSNLNAQYFNNIYNYEEVREFESEIHLMENNSLIEIGGGRLDIRRGIIIRKLDNYSNLLWTDYIANDSLDLYLTWTHTSTIKDSMLYITATAQKYDGVPIFTYLYFIKYNLNQQKLIDLKFYPRELNHTIHTMVYPNCTGVVYDEYRLKVNSQGWRCGNDNNVAFTLISLSCL